MATSSGDPMNSSDEAVNAAVDAVYAFYADPDTYGHSRAMYERDMRIGIEAAWPLIAASVRAEAVADERRRIDAEIRQSFPSSPRYMPRDAYNGMRDAFRVALDIVAAGSVPVATPLAPADRWGLTHNGDEYGPFDTKQAALAYGGMLAAAEIGPMHEWNAFPLIAPVATPEPESRIANQRGHQFTFTVEMRGEGFNWSSTLTPQTVRAYDLPAAIAELAKVPFPAWFPDESDETADDQPHS